MFEFILANPSLFTEHDLQLFISANILTTDQADNIRTEVTLCKN